MKENLLVVKVGTNVLSNDGSFDRIGGEISQLSNDETSVILVSSGAISAGIRHDGKYREDVTDAAELQRYALLGWHDVVQRWGKAIKKRISPALITKHELDTAATRAKLLGVIACCLVHGDIFLTNENDAVCDDEIRFGDNDTLAGELAVVCTLSGMFQRVRLILLTNKNGLNRVADDDETLIRTVDDIAAIKKYAGDVVDAHSRGGMITKVRAAEIAKQMGVETFIANGWEDRAIARALAGEIGTRFRV